MWIDQAFPRLAQEGYLITSQPDQNYNCIAYAAGDTGSWWSHLPGYRWPQANRTDHPDSLVEVFQECPVGSFKVTAMRRLRASATP